MVWTADGSRPQMIALPSASQLLAGKYQITLDLSWLD